MIINVTNGSTGPDAYNQRKKGCDHRMVQPVVTGSMAGYVKCASCGTKLGHKLVFASPNEATIEVTPQIHSVEISVDLSTKTPPSE